MLRNDFINLLARTDNDTVVVDINGVLVDVEKVSVDRGRVVIVLDQEDLVSVLTSIAEGRTPIHRPSA